MHSLWLGILVVLSWSSWFNELISLLLSEGLLNSWELVRSKSLVFVSLHVSFRLNVFRVIMVESLGGITLLAPIIKVELIVSSLGLGGGWRFMVGVGLGLSVDLGVVLGVSLGFAVKLVSLLVSVLIFVFSLSICNNSSVFLQVVVGDGMSTLLAPVIQLGLVFGGFRLGGSWALRSLLHVELRFGLDQVAVVELAFNPVEEVTDKLSLRLLIEVSENVRINFLLEELVHIDFQV